MASKSKSKRVDKIQVEEVKPTPVVSEEYSPSNSPEKYEHIKTPEYSYKILATRGDYIKLQEEVTRHLNDGWSLTGGVSTAIHFDSYNSVTVFTQAIYKQKNS